MSKLSTIHDTLCEGEMSRIEEMDEQSRREYEEYLKHTRPTRVIDLRDMYKFFCGGEHGSD